jgi:hypothetical protein
MVTGAQDMGNIHIWRSADAALWRDIAHPLISLNFGSPLV